MQDLVCWEYYDCLTCELPANRLLCLQPLNVGCSEQHEQVCVETPEGQLVAARWFRPDWWPAVTTE